MGKFFLGMLTVLLIIAVGVGCLWVFDLFGIVDSKELILDQTGKVTGLKNLAENYELGKKRSAVLEKKEAGLAAKERSLVAREAKLQTARDELEDQKQAWLKERSRLAAKKQEDPGEKNTVVKAEIKDYLATLGAMQAEKAAAVIQTLPDETVFLIFEQLRAKQAAKLMESLPTDYLSRLTKARIRAKKP
jgi:flagellar motility protein MotE (MotC chaperone)